MFPTMMTIRKKSHVIAFHFFFLLLPLPLPAQPGAFPGASEPQLNRNMAVAFVALICAFFLLGLFSVYTRQCTEGRFGRYPGNLPGGQRGVGALPWTRSSRGLDPTFVATFPTFVYSTVKGHKIGKSSLECAVCLNEFESSDTLRLIPKCSHAFHSVCIDAWLVSHTTCPVCRANLIPKPGDASLSLLDLDPSIGSEGSRIRQPENHVSISVAGEESAMERNVINSSQMVSRTPPPRSNTRPTGWRFSGIFQRSNSTGHERFTLRLPEEVRNQLLNSTLKRPRSWTELPGVQSSRQGYRSGTGENGREKKHLARTSSVPAPFFGRAGTGSTPKKDEEDSGERSFAHLRPSGIGPGPGAAAE